MSKALHEGTIRVPLAYKTKWHKTSEHLMIKWFKDCKKLVDYKPCLESDRKNRSDWIEENADLWNQMKSMVNKRIKKYHKNNIPFKGQGFKKWLEDKYDFYFEEHEENARRLKEKNRQNEELIDSRKRLATFVLNKVDELQAEFDEKISFTPLVRGTRKQQDECIKQFDKQIQQTKQNINEAIFINTDNKQMTVFQRRLQEFLIPLDDLVELAEVIKLEDQADASERVASYLEDYHLRRKKMTWLPKIDY